MTDGPRSERRATRAEVLGHPLDVLDLPAASTWLLEAARDGRGARVVTLNPELVVRALRDAELTAAVDEADLVVADGVGVVWAARREGIRLPGRVPGVELALDTLRRGGDELAVYFLGGKPGVAERAADAARTRYGTRTAGAGDGYFGPDAEADVVQRVAGTGADLLLAGLGERQELFLARHLPALGVGAAMGVGGTLDVLAGSARRTPGWTHRTGLEWAWRVGTDPRRWSRAPRLGRFVVRVLTGR